MIHVLIVDDDPIARALFSLYIENEPGYVVVDAIESAAMAEAVCLTKQVDLILMDICTAAHASGLHASEIIHECFPYIRIILVTSQPEVDFLSRARTVGVQSFWYKTTDEYALIDVVRRTVAGEKVWPDMLPAVEIGLCSGEDFTEQELEILRELITGDTNREIADRLHLSRRTVENHVQRMLDKTGFSSRTKLACAAVNSGLVIRNM